MKLILNEKEVLNKSLNAGFVDLDKPTNTIRILTKHYLSLGMNRPQTINFIDKFLLNNYKGYNSVKWQKTVEKIVNSIHRDKDYRLVNIEKVDITKKELEEIKYINNDRLERIAFTLLIYAKIFNQLNENKSNWVNSEHKDIFSDAKVTVTVREQGEMIYKLGELGLVTPSKMVDCTNIKVNFVDENSETIIVISDFRNFIYEYLKWKGDKIGNCERCGVLIKITNGNLKYCKKCAKEVWNDYNREKQKEYYNNKKNSV